MKYNIFWGPSKGQQVTEVGSFVTLFFVQSAKSNLLDLVLVRAGL